MRAEEYHTGMKVPTRETLEKQAKNIDRDILTIRTNERKLHMRMRELAKLWWVCDERREKHSAAEEGWDLLFEWIDEDVADFTRYYDAMVEFLPSLADCRETLLGVNEGEEVEPAKAGAGKSVKTQQKKQQKKHGSKRVARSMVREYLIISNNLVRDLSEQLALHKKNIEELKIIDKQVIE